jgi:ribosome-associated toxin RatA of RatAB toxin-antitoxin module
MRRLRGTASAAVCAPLEDCFALLRAVERYPCWYPDAVREVEVVERGPGGSAEQARATLHVSAGPLVRDFVLLLEVRSQPPKQVNLVRIPNDPSDEEQFEVRWQLDERAGKVEIVLGLEANLSVPRLLPLGGIGESMARGFVDAAATALTAGTQ